LKRPRQHEMETEAENLIRTSFPSAWIIRSVEKDYGIDFEVELVDQNIVSGNRLWIQSKAVERATVGTMTFDSDIRLDYVKFKIDTNLLQYALKCPFPLLLFITDLSSREIYWLPIRDDIDVRLKVETANWQRQTTVTLRIPTTNMVSVDASIDYHDLRWFALEPARMAWFGYIHFLMREYSRKWRLSGYQIGDGYVDDEDHLYGSLVRAGEIINEVLGIETVFGIHGANKAGATARYWVKGGVSPTATMRVLDARDAVDRALGLLHSGSFEWGELAGELGTAAFGLGMLSEVIAFYITQRPRFVLSEWNALDRGTGSP